MALTDKLTAIAEGFRFSRGTTDKYTLEQMAIMAAEGSMNLTVIGSTSTPQSPKENTIWIKTSTTISDWAFSASAPIAAEGLVWIKTGTSSTIAFNASPKGVVMIYPLQASQYINGAWVTVEAKSYIGGEWKTWFTYLYNNGGTDISGGFQASAVKPSGGGGTLLTPTTAYFDNTKHPLKIWIANGNYCFSLFNNTAFSVNNINRIEIVYSDTSTSGITLCVTNSRSANYTMAASVSPTSSSGTAIIDVSSLTGSYYFGAFLHSDYNNSRSLTISEIRLI